VNSFNVKTDPIRQQPAPCLLSHTKLLWKWKENNDAHQYWDTCLLLLQENKLNDYISGWNTELFSQVR